MPSGSHVLAAPIVLAALASAGLAGCGGGDPAPSSARDAGTATTPAPAGSATSTEDPGTGTTGAPGGPSTSAGAPGTATTPGRTRTRTPGRPAVDVPPRSWTATCPTATRSPLGCRAVRARVLGIESVDPDGDGDLHVVAVGGDVTAPGLTVFDVRPALRPRRDPVKGEWVTGAGPVFEGSLGQRQIQVDAFRVWRPRD